MEQAEPILHFWQAVSLFFENANLQELIRHHKGWFDMIVFVWTAMQGQSFLIFAGAAAAQDVLDIRTLILCAWAGGFFGDQVCFYLGRKYGTKILHKFPKMETAIQRVLIKIERHDRVFILIYRFIYGVRNISPFALGMSHLTWKEYTTWNVVGALIAALGYSMLGFLFGEVLDNVLGELHGLFIAVAVLIVVLVAGRYIVKKLRK
jgi:membrane protein DedA with SNARE-associated domain